MADTNQSRRVEFLDDDPFAELTRIMGHDPRAPQAGESAGPVAESGDDFDIDLEKELMGELDFSEFDSEPEAQAADAAPEPASDWRVDEPAGAGPEETGFAGAAAEEVADLSGDAGAEPSFDEDFGATLERELFAGQDEPEFDKPEFDEPASPEPVSFAPADEPAGVEDALDTEPAAPEEKPAAGPLDELSAPEWDDEPVMETAEEEEPLPQQDVAARESASYRPAEPVSFAPADLAPAAGPEPAALSLEDELNALLGGGEPAPAALQADDAASAHAPDSWQPAVDTFGRANFATLDPQEEPRGEDAPPEPADAFGGDGFDAIFDDDFALGIEEEPAAQPEPQPQSQPAAARAGGLAALSSWLPAQAAPPAADMPDVETLEVSEAAQPVADDLDIPEIDYGTPAPRLYDELEDEFAQAFADLSPSDQPEPAAHAAPARFAAASGPEEEPSADAHAPGEGGGWQDDDLLGDDGFGYESDLEQAMTMQAYDDDVAEEAPPRRRGLLVAAIVGGVALVGGVGVFGMSFFGGGSDAPAIVLADTDPMKVRPENPGGTTVPNQDSQVYQRVAGGAQDAEPGQERLITSAEEPMDVTAGEPAPLAPGISEEGGEETAVAAPKAEDRLDPAETAASAEGPGEVAAVAPRRVRTMVVRPDGTLVPREEVEPAAAEPAASPAGEPSETVLAPPPALAVPSLAPANTALPGVGEAPGAGLIGEDAALVEEEEGGPVVETPPTVSVVPTSRAEPRAAAARPAVQQQPAAQLPAATPVSAPAAAATAASGAASEWSMQIASQPTAESAQATYQDLARRYGGVLEGRGVNIVRADIEGMGTYYRVRIPASNRDEAIQLCTRYKASGGSCFVSR